MSENTLNEFEEDVAKELINIGLGNAADAFSSMVNEKVLIDSFDMKLGSIKEFQNKLEIKDEKLLHCISTEVKGDIPGLSYLLFNDHEASQVLKLSMPDAYPNFDQESIAEMQGAILTELDNIVTASVITKFANIMGIKMYGHVPQQKTGNNEEIKQVIKEEAEKYDIVLSFKTRFKLYESNIMPSYIWFFKTGFPKAIKNMVEDRNAMNLLRSYEKKSMA